MADEDEDNMRNALIPSDEVDLSEETQDFRFLNNLAFTGVDMPKIPKRGEKDFETHGTELQSSTLEASRAAMHAALSIPRIHIPKSHVIATYDPTSNMAFVHKIKTQHFQTMGKHISGKEWLLPEEALFMLERGSLDIRWPVLGGQEPSKLGEEDQLGIPMSLQGAYAAFIGMERETGGRLTMEMYSVYTNLKRAGYIVLRADSFNQPRPDLNESHMAPEPVPFFQSWTKLLPFRHRTPKLKPLGPLARPGLYRSYNDIYRLLQIIPSHDQRKKPEFELSQDFSNPFRITFHVYKPSSEYRKTNPGPPDFRLSVINAREVNVPSLAELNDLLATTPYDPPAPKDQLYQKLRQGHRSVVLAVVDQGIISYMRFSDAGFRYEQLGERAGGMRGNKRGGFRGRGRGRGRGRR